MPIDFNSHFSLNIKSSSMQMARNMKFSERLKTFISPVSFMQPMYFASSAWIEHAPFAFWLIENLRPNLLVELGVDLGYSYFSFCQAINVIGTDARCYAIDIWRGDEHAGLYRDDVFNRVRTYNDQHYAGFSSLIRETFDEAVSQFPDGSVDLLHIDGRHFYEDVKHDFETWRPKLSKRAVVLFHDTQVLERGFGVHRFWQEVRNQHASFEFEHGYGLGVLAVGSQLPESLVNFFEVVRDTEIAGQVRHIYSRLGHALSLDFNTREKHQANIELTIYFAFDAIQTYSENRTVKHRYLQSEECTRIDLVFPPDVQPLSRLRLDIANSPVAITLHSLAVHQADSAEIWRWDGGCDLFVNQAEMVCLPEDQGVLLLSLSNDPHCELALSPEVLSRIRGGCFFRLELTARPLLNVLPAVLSRLQTKSEAALPGSLRPQLPASVSGHLAELGELLNTVVERKNATIAAQKTELQVMQNRQYLLNEQLVRAEAQLDLLKQLVFPEATNRLERL